MCFQFLHLCAGSLLSDRNRMRGSTHRKGQLRDPELVEHVAPSFVMPMKHMPLAEHSDRLMLDCALASLPLPRLGFPSDVPNIYLAGLCVRQPAPHHPEAKKDAQLAAAKGDTGLMELMKVSTAQRVRPSHRLPATHVSTIRQSEVSNSSQRQSISVSNISSAQSFRKYMGRDSP